MTAREAVIVDAVRTPVGRHCGALATAARGGREVGKKAGEGFYRWPEGGS